MALIYCEQLSLSENLKQLFYKFDDKKVRSLKNFFIKVVFFTWYNIFDCAVFDSWRLVRVVTITEILELNISSIG